MRWMTRIATGLLAVLLLAGCNEYEVKTIVRGDGSGTRTAVFKMDPDQDELTDRSPEMYARMFGIGADGKWQMQTIGDSAEYSDKPGKRHFRMESAIAGVEDWSRLDGSIGASVCRYVSPVKYCQYGFSTQVLTTASSEQS